MNTANNSPEDLKNTISRAYTKHISSLMLSNPSHAPYMVTTVFKQRLGERDLTFPQKVKRIHCEYDRVYRHVTSRLANNFSRKRYLHPLTFDFIDIPNSRCPSRINFSELKTPHIHSVYLLHEATKSRYEALIEENFESIIRHRSMASLASIHAVAFDPWETEEIVGYSSKIFELTSVIALSQDQPLFTQYPIAEFEQRIRRDGIRQNQMLARLTQDERDRVYFERLASR